MNQPQPAEVPVFPPIQVQTSLAQTPAGPLGVVQMTSGATSFSLMLDASQAADLAGTLGRQLTELAAHLRRAKLGLIIPTNGHKPTAGPQ